MYNSFLSSSTVAQLVVFFARCVFFLYRLREFWDALQTALATIFMQVNRSG